MKRSPTTRTPEFVVRQVDGSWYLSPIATSSEQLLAVLRSLTREEIEGLQSSIEDVVEAFEELAAEQELVPLDDEGETVDPAEACWIESEATTAAACFEALVADGSIVEGDVPWYLRYPECGLADLGWSGEYYELADAEFVATVEDASPCFQELVASGEADELDLPVELLRPECLLGRNWYAATDEDVPRRVRGVRVRLISLGAVPSELVERPAGPSAGQSVARGRGSSSTAPSRVSVSPVSSTTTKAGWAGTPNRS